MKNYIQHDEWNIIENNFDPHLNKISESLFSLSSGTVIVPTFGSIVQKGKFAACAFAFDKQLKSVDLPTLGNPTIPHLRAIVFLKFCGRENKEQFAMVLLLVPSSLFLVTQSGSFKRSHRHRK